MSSWHILPIDLPPEVALPLTDSFAPSLTGKM
jgi:hypothetical protein